MCKNNYDNVNQANVNIIICRYWEPIVRKSVKDGKKLNIFVLKYILFMVTCVTELTAV